MRQIARDHRAYHAVDYLAIHTSPRAVQHHYIHEMVHSEQVAIFAK
jgi:hypothetical protein